MARLVGEQGTRGPGRGELNAGEATTPNQGVQDYLERLGKYIPIEIVAGFIAIRGLLSPSGTAGAVPPVVEFALYGALVLFTPWYLYKFGGEVPQKRLQLVLATLSFVIWSYGIGGPFFFKALEHSIGARLEYPGLSAAIVIVWSLAIGAVKPKQ